MSQDSARLRFKRFHGRDAKRGEIARVKTNTSDVLLVGELEGVIYKSCSDGKSYIHKFRKSRPHLYVSSDGKQLYALGGAYRFTERGFVG